MELELKGLLSVLNVGFIYYLLPLIGFLITVIVNKRIQPWVSVRIKKFIIQDLSYSWLLITGFLITYGLSLSVTSSDLSGVSIAGIVISLVYYAIFSFISLKCFKTRESND
jgi:hypothetical protein